MIKWAGLDETNEDVWTAQFKANGDVEARRIFGKSGTMSLTISSDGSVIFETLSAGKERRPSMSLSNVVDMEAAILEIRHVLHATDK